MRCFVQRAGVASVTRPDLYTDSVVKLSPRGKAGILIELSARTGKLVWKLPVGVHSGHENDGLLTENAAPTAPIPLPAKFSLEPGVFGGVESQLATSSPPRPTAPPRSPTTSCSPRPTTVTSTRSTRRPARSC